MEKFGINITSSKSWRRCYDCRNGSSEKEENKCFADIFGNGKCMILVNTKVYKNKNCPFYKVDANYDPTLYPEIKDDEKK